MMPEMSFFQNANITASHHYPDADSEFVFSYRGQPFAAAIASSCPAPTSTLIDFAMVRDFKMKMTDFKCQKFSFANQKLRIVGKISSFVQYVKDGTPLGQYKFSATVVRGLTQALDVDSIAGTRLVSQLTGKSEDVKPSPEPAAKPSPKPAAKTSPELAAEQSSESATKTSPKCDDAAEIVPAAVPGVQPVATPGLAQDPPVPPAASAAPPAPSTPPRAPTTSSARSPRSPPGFPATPQHQASSFPASTTTDTKTEATIPVQRVLDGLPMSPFTANIRALAEAFNDADMTRDVDEQMKILEDVDSDGDVDFDENEGSYMYKLTNGLRYTVGHGRHGCTRKKCPKTNFNKKKIPSNCGYHPQWALPEGFQHCGDRCKAAFCPCLRQYHSHTPAEIAENRKKDEEERLKIEKEWK